MIEVVRRPLFAILLLLGLVALPATPAFSATSDAKIQAILRDCEEDGSLEGSYRPSELRDAARNIGTDLDQYSDCRDVISAAVLGAVSGGGASGGSGGSSGGGGSAGGGSPTAGAGGEAGTGTGAVDGGGTTVPSTSGDGFNGSGALLTPAGPEEQEALEELAATPLTETAIGGRPLSVLGTSDFGAIGDHQLPVPLIVALGLLTAGGLVAGLPNLRRRVLDRRAA